MTEAETTLLLPKDVRLVLVNEGGHGFFRVHYENDLLKALLDNPGNLAPIERFNLVNDARAGVQAGVGRLDAFLDLTARFRSECATETSGRCC